MVRAYADAPIGQTAKLGAASETIYFRALDFYRFIAAIGVVLFHYAGLVGYRAEPNLRHLVDFFFILSGFVMMHTYINLKQSDVARFIIRRFARIYPLHLATLLFFIVYGLARARAGAGDSPQYDWSAILPNLLMVHAWGTTGNGTFNFPSWSISAEWFVYLLFPIFLGIYRRLNSGFGLFIVAIAIGVILTGIDIATHDRSWTLRTYDWGAIRAVPAFLMGMSFRVMRLPRVGWPVVYPIILAYAALYAFALPGEIFVLSSGLVIALTASAKGTSFLESPRLKILCDASYGVYMIHLCVGGLVLNGLKQQDLVPPLVLVGIATLTTIAVATISFHCFEKPARDWLRKVLEEPRPNRN